MLDVRPMLRGSEKAVIEAALGRRPGVLAVEANPVSQTATVTYDPSQASVRELRRWVEECGDNCAGQSVPAHLCDPLREPDPPAGEAAAAAGPRVHPAEGTLRSPQEVMGHGGHGEMSMAAMVADMRSRFLVAALFSIPIVLWSPIGRDVLGFDAGVPLGLREDVFALLLSLPVIFYSCSIFFTGAVSALRARTLDMMVLVAVAVGAGWLDSLVVTVTGGGEVFYEAATVLASFVLLGALVRDAGAGRRQRRDPHAARPGAAEGAGDPRRRAGRGADGRGPGRRPAARAAGRQDRGRRRRGAPAPRWRGSSSSCRRRRTRRRPASGWPTGRRSGSCSWR